MKDCSHFWTEIPAAECGRSSVKLWDGERSSFVSPWERWSPATRWLYWRRRRRIDDREDELRASNHELLCCVARHRSGGPGRRAGSDWCRRRRVPGADWRSSAYVCREAPADDSAGCSSCPLWCAVVAESWTPWVCSDDRSGRHRTATCVA